MTMLSRAIRRGDWDLVTLLLALAAGRVIGRLPPGTADDLLDALEDDRG